MGADVTELLPFRTSLVSFLNGLISQKQRRSASPLPAEPIILLPAILQQSVELPRYVRVNTLKVTVQEALDHFTNANFLLSSPPADPSSLLGQKAFWEDRDLPEVLVFPFGTDLHDDLWVTEGKLVLQDKASCLSAFVLLEDSQPAERITESSPQRHCNVIDACAAPGNKTTHAAALMGRHSHGHQLFAVDKDDKRILLLKEFTQKAGAPVRVLHQSFLDIDPAHHPQLGHITHLMVDPSCSGSGIVSRLDSLINMNGFTTQRKEQLAKFQKTILCHAMSCKEWARLMEF